MYFLYIIITFLQQQEITTSSISSHNFATSLILIIESKKTFFNKSIKLSFNHGWEKFIYITIHKFPHFNKILGHN